MSQNPKNGHDRTGFYSRYQQPPQVQIDFNDPSRTTQDYAGEANINTLMAKYAQTGLLGPKGAPMEPPTFRDVRHLQQDYHQAMNTVRRAQELFEASPARIRDRFGNQPSQLLAFLSDPNNRQEAEKLGLIEKRPQEAAQAVNTGGVPPNPPKD